MIGGENDREGKRAIGNEVKRRKGGLFLEGEANWPGSRDVIINVEQKRRNTSSGQQRPPK